MKKELKDYDKRLMINDLIREMAGGDTRSFSHVLAKVGVADFRRLAPKAFIDMIDEALRAEQAEAAKIAAARKAEKARLKSIEKARDAAIAKRKAEERAARQKAEQDAQIKADWDSIHAEIQASHEAYIAR
ncbi:MAG: hypothetical protein R3E02_01895 [Blastomonas sp.]